MATTKFTFANLPVPSGRVFYNRPQVFAFVLHNQVLPGHILLCPKQANIQFRELNSAQLFELTLAIKELQEII